MKTVKTVTAENLQKAWDEGGDEVQQVLEKLYPDFFESPYRIGDRFVILDNHYILSYIEDCDDEYRIMFTDLISGSCYLHPIIVNDRDHITAFEIKFLLKETPFQKINL